MPLAPAEVGLASALGCRLASRPVADVDAPPGDVSAMDGYAVRRSDLERGEPLAVAFEVAAESVAPPLPAASAARIFTGAVVPESADTVIPQELAHVKADGRVSLEALAMGSYVRSRGEVFTVGDRLADAGALVTPQLIALLAAGGAHRVVVVPRPRIAVVLTGSEVVPPSEVPGPGQIRNSNGPMLDALVRTCGCDPPMQLGATDCERELRRALADAAVVSDLVLTSGGVSVGDYDLVPEVLCSLGAEILFHKVVMKPGKPILAARLRGKWVVGLPGNPVSVLVGWRMFARPLAGMLSGDETAFHEQPVEAALEEAVENRGWRPVLQPSVLTQERSGASVRVLPWKGSHDLVAASRANALAHLEAETAVEAGTRVPCYPLAVGEQW